MTTDGDSVKLVLADFIVKRLTEECDATDGNWRSVISGISLKMYLKADVQAALVSYEITSEVDDS